MFADPALFGTASGRALVLAGMLLVVGAASCSWMVPSRGIARPVRTGALLLLAGVLVQTWGQLLAFEAWAPDAEPIRDTLAIIGNTNWGRTRLAVSAIAFVAILVSFTRHPVLDVSVRAVAIALLGVLPLLGHAASSSNVPLAYTLGVAHAAGAGIWLGTLALLAPTWWMGLHSTIVMLPRYGRIALFAAPVVVISGALTVWTRLESPAELLSTTYGRLILAKASLVVIILIFGARHHRRLTRPMDASHDAAGAVLDARVLEAHASRRSLVLELLLAVLVLALTGWLGESEPPTLE